MMFLAITHLIMAFAFAGMGLLMGPVARQGPNRWIGIRLPQTMDDKRVWRDTHIDSRPMWFFIAALFLMLAAICWFLPELEAENYIFFHIFAFVGVVIVALPWCLHLANRAKKKWQRHDELYGKEPENLPIEPE